MLIVIHRWFTMTWRFGQSDITWNNRTIHFTTKVLFQLIRNFIGQAVTWVVHGTQDTFNFEVIVNHGGQFADRIH
ncbi:Uncharacterised protein [Vibrio cholerae]|nr:Uncharacterised protein [Vibrio cholerae]CSI66577.1 Uncharacterised protein [Vibrio cholerae]